jgi:outer membrane protein TolC
MDLPAFHNLGLSTNDNAVSIAKVDVEASWELDLFGRNRAQASEASALLQSTEASRQAVRVALLAEVARNYFDLGWTYVIYTFGRILFIGCDLLFLNVKI